MISVKIYCNRKHKDYDTTYNVLNEVMLENNLDFQINRITEAKAMELQHIIHEPHIVINSQVVYTGSCPSKDDAKEILRRLQLIK